ncbi:DsbA family protein [Carboxylicivirga mesophila]|uniref:DsbA family protein n=1 Tax=Carboxylicivirga mesophila TaxID=1166478 RepID=A0ABS5KGL4_9BACT|nr:DsbA family protein [Carboxylicivirga mesophila]MBS2213972.1 DsbA family protein [Carboxylicivirga mesophila]
MKLPVIVSIALALINTYASTHNMHTEKMKTETPTKVTIEFYHDVLCAWCFALSPRVRQLAENHPEIEIIHRSFALSPNKERITQVFGSKEEGKRQIIQHWKAANANDDQHRINAELMVQKTFDYPYSMPALMACKAAEFQGGEQAHWDYFDAVQKAHLSECRNINDPAVLIDVAQSLHLDIDRFKRDFESKRAQEAVEVDMESVHKYGVNSVPTLIINQSYKVSGAVSYNDLEDILTKVLNETINN